MVRSFIEKSSLYVKKSKKDYRQLVGTLFRKWSISCHLWFSHSKFYEMIEIQILFWKHNTVHLHFLRASDAKLA